MPLAIAGQLNIFHRTQNLSRNKCRHIRSTPSNQCAAFLQPTANVFLRAKLMAQGEKRETSTKTVSGREIQVNKVYLCLFTCGSTTAIHIELTPSLTTQVFIRCLRRFVARRGFPELIISDNAKTFKAAATQLTRIFSDPDVMSFHCKEKSNGSLILRKPHSGGGGGGV